MFTKEEMKQMNDEITFQIDGEESTLNALRVQERLAHPYIPATDPPSHEQFEMPQSSKAFHKKTMKLTESKDQKFTGKSIRRAMTDQSASSRGIPQFSTEALQSLIHSKMLLEQHMRRQAKKNQRLSIDRARQEKYSWYTTACVYWVCLIVTCV